MLEKLFFLPKKCIYFISYRNEHPVLSQILGFMIRFYSKETLYSKHEIFTENR